MDKKISTATVRELINKILLTDSSFDAFCIDHFPAVKRRFADGMDRVRKVNILLEVGGTENVYNKLIYAYSKKIAKHLSPTTGSELSLYQKIENSDLSEREQISPSMRELISILEARAKRIIKYLATNHSMECRKFRDLHKRHVLALKKGEMVLAHEIAREAQELIHNIKVEIGGASLLNVIKSYLPGKADALNSDEEIIQNKKAESKENESTKSTIPLDKIMPYFTPDKSSPITADSSVGDIKIQVESDITLEFESNTKKESRTEFGINPPPQDKIKDPSPRSGNKKEPQADFGINPPSQDETRDTSSREKREPRTDFGISSPSQDKTKITSFRSHEKKKSRSDFGINPPSQDETKITSPDSGEKTVPGSKNKISGICNSESTSFSGFGLNIPPKGKKP